MEVQIIRADMHKDEEKHYVGHTIFKLADHKSEYEITFFSKRGKDWDYSLNFAGEPGNEEEFLKTDTLVEEDDDLFDTLLDAALDTMEEEAKEE
ncbi:hypothetical protein [Paenibacillus pini]|uniref:Uncharacterized protein n=1 Tax=Paenibacillus pini JCM 16418 TaxID=1236976 RepID=W7YJ54_9BACL|nr:hypothetical protein [Paenibacillus pini]GAF07608.1 hypothetical protein JCM16418_1635 [Paenibacillus pini JCM 16418]